MKVVLLDVLLTLLVLSYPLAALSRIRWPMAMRVGGLCFLLALLNALLQWLGHGVPSHWFSQHPASPVVLLVVTCIGWLVLRFSYRYLAGDAREEAFLRGLQWLLSGVVMVVVTNHVLVFMAGWVGISLALHQLLLFYPERPRAQLAAHKKFIFARLAELSLGGAFLILYLEHHSLWLNELFSVSGPLTGAEKTASVLIALAALIKCAQLPVHGWLIQVVEAPTPVSALLHAGVINLGGYVLILAAPLISGSPAAQALILVVAGTTLVTAALAMSVQTSVKEGLAWSTSAQMGLMLLECALGFYALALLHLVAHSFYKAHSFLYAGDGVNRVLVERHVGARMLRPNLPVAVLLTAILLLTGVAPAVLALFAPLLWLAGAGRALLLTGVYLVQKSLFEHLLPPLAAPGWMATAWVLCLALVLVAGFRRLDDRRAVTLRHWLYAGLFLDHWATRATLRLWPAPAIKQPTCAIVKKESLS
ncbi:NADH-quinone oxidoreductase subunit L [Mangrovitalea sediminis]|uniref:NADH-quinone oxidoreductase subunit L n=1 Tax=Mangrovitalea sediminis TaxID=1982043 RepID=UPI000BE59415|nr:NADH-quinone oxidoreductase subunit L [Mangrovitalea sediminis]